MTPRDYFVRWIVIFFLVFWPALYWCIRLGVRHGIQDTFTEEPKR